MDILDRELKPHPDAIISRVGDETVILHLVNSTYYGLDLVGTRIWEGLGDGSRPRAVCLEVSRIFEADIETVETDARAFLNDLLAHDLLVEG